VLEVLNSTPSVSNLIREAKIFQIPSIMQTGKKYGMCMMNDALTELVKKKVIDPQEAHAKAADKTGLLAMFKKAGVDTSWAPSEASPGAPGPSGSSVAEVLAVDADDRAGPVDARAPAAPADGPLLLHPS